MCAKTQTLIKRADEAKRRLDDAIRYFTTLIEELEGERATKRETDDPERTRHH